jgi:hypothetical protein
MVELRSTNTGGKFQDGQHILITTPSVLLGFRLKVYRAEGTTQWYTAVTTGYNESNNVRAYQGRQIFLGTMHIPKRGKIYQSTTKYTKCPKYTNIFHCKTL